MRPERISLTDILSSLKLSIDDSLEQPSGSNMIYMNQLNKYCLLEVTRRCENNDINKQDTIPSLVNFYGESYQGICQKNGSKR